MIPMNEKKFTIILITLWTIGLILMAIFTGWFFTQTEIGKELLENIPSNDKGNTWNCTISNIIPKPMNGSYFELKNGRVPMSEYKRLQSIEYIHGKIKGYFIRQISETICEVKLDGYPTPQLVEINNIVASKGRNTQED